MDSILVTGATGFIGTHLMAKLRAEHYKVFGANRQCGNIDADATWSAFPDSEVVVHLAGRTFVPESWSDPEGFLRTNLQGTVCALNYCRERKAKLIFISSYLYGTPERLPIPETAPLLVNNPYALSKKMAEDVCRFYSDYYGTNIIILRPFNVYGPGQDNKFLIPSIIEQASKGGVIHVKDVEPRRDYIYIDDLTEAFVRAVEQSLHFDVFNIGSGISHSVSDLICLVQDMAKTKLTVCSLGERRLQEVMDTRADITHASEILGWSPRWSLKAGIERCLQERKLE